MKKWIFDSYLSVDQKSKVFYKYKAPKAYQLTISCLAKSSDDVSLTFSGEKTATRSFSLSLSQLRSADASGIDENLLSTQFIALVVSYESNFGETLRPTNPPSPSPSPSSTSSDKSQPHSLKEMLLQTPLESESRQQPPSMNARVSLEAQDIPRLTPPLIQSNHNRGDFSQGPQNRGSIGDRDLNPYGDILISPHSGGLGRLGGLNPFPENGGNLVGPNHPMFREEGSGFYIGDNRHGGGAGYYPPDYPPLPTARFDPYGPVTGPNGPNFGISGQPPSFLPPGVQPSPAAIDPNTGAAAGKKPHTPGEPNPDHLKPPSENNDSMFG